MKTIDISFRNLKSLRKDLPEIVWEFECVHSELTSLRGAPRIVGRNLYFWHNRLISLDFLPLKFMRMVKTIAEL